MEDTITELTRACLQRQQVGLLDTTDGAVLLVYPLDQGAIIGIGTPPGFERKLRMVLGKRTSNLPRYGKWKPALFNDGSCFVITRVPEVLIGQPVIEPDLISAAMELIS